MQFVFLQRRLRSDAKEAHIRSGRNGGYSPTALRTTTMEKTRTTRGLYYNNGRGLFPKPLIPPLCNMFSNSSSGITTIYEEVEVQYRRGSTARINLPGNPPQAYGYTSPPVLPQGSHHGSSYQPHPTPSHRSTRSIVSPGVAHHPPPSSRRSTPRDQSGRSHRSSNDGHGRTPSPGALIPYNNPNSIERWAHGVTPGNTPTASLIGSDVRSNGSTSHRSDKSRDQHRRRDEGMSRRGSGYNDHGNDAESHADGRSSRLDPRPNKLRRGSTIQGSPSHCSHHPSVTRR